jgi:hypothetical protein
MSKSRLLGMSSYSVPNQGAGKVFGRLRNARYAAFTSVFAGILLLGVTACVAPSQQTVKLPEERMVEQPLGQSTQNDTGLIKPTIPGEQKAPTEVVPPYQAGARYPGSVAPEPEATPPGRLVAPPIAQTAPPNVRAAPLDTRAGAPREPQGKRWEDQKVRTAAVELARGIPTVKKIKICYEVEEGEWWVSLYDDAGTAIDIKQYVWDPESERLEPHLVLNRIPRSQFQRHLKGKQQGRACEIIDPPKR